MLLLMGGVDHSCIIKFNQKTLFFFMSFLTLHTGVQSIYLPFKYGHYPISNTSHGQHPELNLIKHKLSEPHKK